jgi:hypothetical protein
VHSRQLLCAVLRGRDIDVANRLAIAGKHRSSYLADAVQELTAKLQGLKHGDQFTDPARVDELAHLTIAWIGELLN